MPQESSSRSLSAYFLPLLLLTAAFYTWRPLMAFDDFWNHAAVGRWILENRQFPHETLFLWTAKQEWVAHSWGTQLFFGLLMRAGGVWGPRLALAFGVVMVCAVYFLLWQLWQKHQEQSRFSLFGPILFLLAIGGSVGRYAVRPELFTALFLTILIVYLVRNHSPRLGWPEVGIVVMFLLWVNMHGAFLLGLALLAMAALGDSVQDRFDVHARKLWILWAGCVAMFPCNPYGLGLIQSLRQVNSLTFAAIDEWKPFWAVPHLEYSGVAAAFILFFAAAGVWFANPQRRWTYGIWLLFIGAAFLQARRQLWMLMIICLAVAAVNSAILEKVSQRFAATRQRQFQKIILGIMLVNFLVGPFYDFLRGGPYESDLPIALCDYIDRYNPPGRVFNGFNNAAYLAWHFGETRPLYADHLQAYSDDLTRNYMEITSATKQGQRLLDEQKIGYILLHNPRDLAPWPRLALYLFNSPDWELVFYDNNAVMWVRKTPDYAALRAVRNQYVPAEFR